MHYAAINAFVTYLGQILSPLMPIGIELDWYENTSFVELMPKIYLVIVHIDREVTWLDVLEYT